MSSDKVLNFVIRRSQIMDDGIDGDKDVPTIGYYLDSIINPDRQLANIK
jgi:hypothetical protein